MFFWNGSSYTSSTTHPATAEWVNLKSAQTVALPQAANTSYTLTATATAVVDDWQFAEHSGQRTSATRGCDVHA